MSDAPAPMQRYVIVNRHSLGDIESEVDSYVERGYVPGQIVRDPDDQSWIVPVVLTMAEEVRVATLKAQQEHMIQANGMLAEQLNYQAQAVQQGRNASKYLKDASAAVTMELGTNPIEAVTVTKADFATILEALGLMPGLHDELLVKVKHMHDMMRD